MVSHPGETMGRADYRVVLAGQLIAVMPAVEDADRATVERALMDVADAASTVQSAIVYRFEPEAPVTLVHAGSVRGRDPEPPA